MNQTQIINEVTATIRRPDLTSDIARAVRATITEVHTAAHWAQDLVEHYVDIVATNNPKFTPPDRYRETYVLALVDSNSNFIPLPTQDGVFELTSPGEFMTPGGKLLNNIYYDAGTQVVVRSSIQVTKLYHQYYRNPDVTNATLETWAMKADGDMFVYGALAKLYSTPLRQYELAQENRRLFQEALTRLIEQYN